MKKFKAVLLSILVLFLVSTNVNSVKAEDTGSIKIDNPVEGETYKLYKLVDLKSYTTDGSAYLYTIETTSNFYNFLTEGTGKNYVKITEAWDEANNDTINVVSWVKDASVSDFTKAALAYIKANNIAPLQSVKCDTTEINFTNLSLGYYLVESSLGALCSIDTTDPDVVIHEKNSVPSVEKRVDRNGILENNNTASIGDELSFTTIITAYAGAENYELVDTASAGITFTEDCIQSIKINDTDLTRDDYTFTLDNAHQFTIKFAKEFLNKINAQSEIVVVYKGTLNENAVIGDVGNSNSTYLKYGVDSKTNTSSTTTYTYEFQVVKTTADEKVLTGATFNLYKGSNLLEFVKGENNTYRLATANDQNTTSAIEAGIATIQGLGNGTYGLVEVSAPAGYTPIDYSVNVLINGANNDAVIENNKYIEKGIQVINRTGGILPNTGGTGNKVIVAVGVATIIAALVLITIEHNKKAK